MSIVETHATVSHRYYMRKTKAEIVQRIRDMLREIPISMVEKVSEQTFFEGQYDRHRCLWVVAKHRQEPLKIPRPDKMYDKRTLASAAMLAHELLGKVQAMPELTSCAADCDDMCDHPKCPQNRDGEPTKTGRHCPLHDPAWRDGDEG